ncbi:transposase, IS4 family [Bacteroides pyogenes F0041]|uniref:Transposase, IS4 family n=2 Tax=Bacteroides pyogenes TaxID=310300 RepID=U2CWQ6_9BACE|nr:transposase, IS4 family [Bacteroides pyogenes F0041]MBB3893707.1 hypothetical protein [Bacteroides pyogenes]GAE23095.1 transposase [Bacteroides pyogenes JCM 10003]SUV33566.1 transposase [Bacteroides pyogenes]
MDLNWRGAQSFFISYDMFKDKYVFAQPTSFLDRSKFNRIVAKYQGDKYVKSFTCWNQLLAMMFGRLCYREGLRDLIVALQAHQEKWYHLGLGKSVTRSNLSKANENRDYHIFEDFAYYMVEQARTKPIKWRRRMPKNVLSDSEGILTVYKSSKDYPIKIRKVEYWDEEQNRQFVFLTNAFDLTALQVALLYKNRWQVELFFKWLKQHLKIKKFWGTSENAVRIQVYCAIISYCLVAVVQHDMQLERSIYEVLQILSISLTDKSHLVDLFSQSKFNNVKDQSGLDGLSLFDNFNF